MTAGPQRWRGTVAGMSAQRWRPQSPDGPSILLLHGAMDRSDSFARTARRLGNRDVLAVDRRGYAGSRLLGCADIAGHASDVLNIVDELRGEWVVVGHSLGGTIALSAATAGHPSVVAVGTYESPAPWLDGSIARVGGGSLKVADERGDAAAAEYFFTMMVGDEAWARLGESFREQRRADGPALVAELRDLASGRVIVDPGEVGVPVTVGRGSSVDDLATQAELLVNALSCATLVEIPGAPHGVHLTQPDAFGVFVGKVGE